MDDIISSLPDQILIHIFSFLSIKSCARTSVLARRWRFLWTCTPNLHFYEDFRYDSDSKNRMGFADMVDRVLLLHSGSIDSLIIHLDERTPVREHQSDAWIRTAMAHGVHDFLLSAVWFPQFHYKCKNLVELTLKHCIIYIESGAVCLPRLKKLHLLSNCYRDDQSLPNLVSGCSAIEDLIIERYTSTCDDMICCYVCSPTLKSLVLDWELECDFDHKHKLVLDVPAVQYLRIQDDVSQIIRADKLSSLVVADIWFLDGLMKPNVGRSRDRFQFFEKLFNSKSLTLTCLDSMKLLNPPFSFASTRFHNLTELKFKADWHILTEVLACASKLESLTIREVEGELKCWEEPKQLSECLLPSLKYVSIYGFAGREHEVDMVQYVLRHAKILEEIKIYSVPRCKAAYSKLNMLQRIAYFPRGSQECRLTFV